MSASSGDSHDLESPGQLEIFVAQGQLFNGVVMIYEQGNKALIN